MKRQNANQNGIPLRTEMKYTNPKESSRVSKLSNPPPNRRPVKADFYFRRAKPSAPHHRRMRLKAVAGGRAKPKRTIVSPTAGQEECTLSYIMRVGTPSTERPNSPSRARLSWPGWFRSRAPPYAAATEQDPSHLPPDGTPAHQRPLNRQHGQGEGTSPLLVPKPRKNSPEQSRVNFISIIIAATTHAFLIKTGHESRANIICPDEAAIGADANFG